MGVAVRMHSRELRWNLNNFDLKILPINQPPRKALKSFSSNHTKAK